MTKLFTVQEVAELLQVHFNTVYELARQNKISSIRIGRQIRITEEAFNDFIKHTN
jgi:excisionase family DNA binding protein